MKIPPENALLVRVDAAAAMLGLAKSQVRKMTEDGTLPPLRQLAPRAVGFLKSDLVQWAESRPIVARQANRADDVLNPEVDPKEWAAAGGRGDDLMEEVGFARKRA